MAESTTNGDFTAKLKRPAAPLSFASYVNEMSRPEYVFPPSTLWYRSQVMAASAISESMVVIHASFNINLTVINKRVLKVPCTQVLCPNLQSKAKLGCVAILGVDDSQVAHLAAGDDRGHVHYWKAVMSSSKLDVDVTDRLKHEKHSELDNLEGLPRSSIESIAFVKGERGIRLVSGSSKGRIIAWEFDVNSFTTFPALNRNGNGLDVIKGHPFLNDGVALGYAKGDVIIALLKGKGEELRRFRSGQHKIHDISFRPLTAVECGDDEDPNETNKCKMDTNGKLYFVVGSQGGFITLFNEQSMLPLAKWALAGSQKSDQKEVTSVSWYRPNAILSRGRNASLIQWDMSGINSFAPDGPRIQNLTFESSMVHTEHSSKLFTIVTAPNLPYIVSGGLDRKLVLYDIDDLAVHCSLPTFGHQVICMASSPVEPSIVAIGAFDSCIRVWKTESRANGIDFETIFITGKAKLLSLAFHPVKESELAFSTEEGKVGFLSNVFSKNALTKIDGHQHEEAIYTLLYGPLSLVLEETQEEGDGGRVKNAGYALFCVCQGRIFVHQPWKHHFKPIELHLPKKNNLSSTTSTVKEVSELAFTSNYDYMAVGLQTGLIQIFGVNETSLTPTLELHASNKAIQALAFHPVPHSSDGKLCEDEENDFRLWLAATSKSKEVVIFKLKFHLETLNTDSTPKLISAPDVVLEGHKERSINLAWNPKKRGMLASAAYDYSAKVFDCLSGQCIAHYGGHSSRVRCCLWSPKDEHNVITGSQDSSVHVWDIRKHTSSGNEGLSKGSNAKEEPSQKQSSIEGQSKWPSTSKEPPREKRRIVTKRNMFPLQQKSENASTPRQCLQVLKSSRKEECGDDKCDDESPINKAATAVFLHNEDYLTSVLEAETLHHNRDNQLDSACELALLTSDVGPLVRSAISSGNLTPFLLTAAAGCDYKLWNEATEAYAKQLIGQGNFGMAAAHYLTIHKPMEALQVYEEGKMFRAAVAVAKLHLSPESSQVMSLYNSWGAQAQNDGNYVLASKCYLASSQLHKASTALAMLNTKEALEVAALLALEAEDHERAKILASKCQLMLTLDNEEVETHSVLFEVLKRLDEDKRNVWERSKVEGNEQ